jgi:type II secretory pathway pseudopilin PulG
MGGDFPEEADYPEVPTMTRPSEGGFCVPTRRLPLRESERRGKPQGTGRNKGAAMAGSLRRARTASTQETFCRDEDWQRRSFTLVESLVAIALMAMAGAAVLAGVYASVHTGQTMLLEAVAIGLAEQWMDEILGCRYHELGGNPYSINFGPEAGEKAGTSREFFDDVDDYHGLVVEPPADRWGIPLGHEDGKGGKRHPALVVPWTVLRQFSVRSVVGYVRKEALGEALAPGSLSDYRAVEVEVGLRQSPHGVEPLCRLRRVTAYLPPL